MTMIDELINEMWSVWRCPYCGTTNRVKDVNVDAGATCMNCNRYIDRYVLRAILKVRES